MRVRVYFNIVALFVATVCFCDCAKTADNPSPDPKPQEEVEPEDGSTVYGKVFCNGQGIKSVVVTDGYEVVVTNEHGVYQLPSAKKNAMVWISIPSGYRPQNIGIQSLFYKYLLKDASTPERVDFELFEDGDQTNHKMLFFGDIHLAARTGDRKQFETFTKEVETYLKSRSGEKIYAITLGDMTWDQYWYSNNYSFQNYLNDINGNIKSLTVFHTMGNHDHDMKTSVDGTSSGWNEVDWDCAAAYRRNLGPNYYSFNIGKVHYISLDNIYCKNTTGGGDKDRHYEDAVSDYALAWLRKDLEHVNKSTRIVVTMHAPFTNQDGSLLLNNAIFLQNCFVGFSKVLFVTGHTHRMSTTEYRGIVEHNSGAVCATWWWTGYYNSTLNVATDGAPGGYRIMDFIGSDCNSYYKAVGRDEKYQFRSYDRNSICIDPSGVTYSSQYQDCLRSAGDYGTPSTANEVILNVWDWNKDWKVEVSENGRALTVTNFSGYDPIFHLTYNNYRYNKTANPSFAAYKTNHLFRVTASSATSTLEIKVTDDEGRVYSETMIRPKSFTIDTYK